MKNPANGTKRVKFRPGWGFVTCKMTRASDDELFVVVDLLAGGLAAGMVSSGDVAPATIQGSTHTFVGKVPVQGKVIVTVLRKIEGGFLVELPDAMVNSVARVQVPEKAVTFP